MRTVADAIKVARTLKPVVVEGQTANEGPVRQIHPHFFVGGNANADKLADGEHHAAMAEERLKSAARVELKFDGPAEAGKPFSFDLLVHNEGAGHNIPTGVTELREMWIDLRVTDSKGEVLFRSGDLDEQGVIRPGTIRFGADAGDINGKKTYKLWEMTTFLWKRTIPPKNSSRDSVTIDVPADSHPPWTVEARLLYRSASPHVVKHYMQDEAFTPKIVEMTRSTVTVPAQ